MRSAVLLSSVAFLTVAAVAACSSSPSGAASGPDGGGDDASAEGGAGDGGSEGSTGDAGDAGADVDNGAPSTNYPAPHPPLPQLVNKAGGPVLTTPHAYLVFYPGYPYETQLQTFAQKMAAATYWATTTQEYGVGALTYAGTIDLTNETPPQSTTSTAIQSWIAGEIQGGKFGTPDPEAIYTVFYPQSTTITQPNPISTLLPAPQSCVAFGGYHDNAAVSLGDGGTPTNFAYAVIPTCNTSVDSLTSVVSHEWVEASTDPFLTSTGAFTINGGPDAAFYSTDADHTIWALMGGGEAGDLCEPEGSPIYVTPPDVGNAVQRTWSNVLAQGSHDPCTPAIAGAFFDSAPVLPDTVTFTSSITGTITTRGTTIPVGQSKTIEVDLFSDGDTGGPWTVSADDVLSHYYGSYGLAKSMSFAWDRTQGVNGEKLHLTITVTSASVIGGGHAFMITSTKGGRQTVWPGMIVE
ncbi:MAG TPA: hypothetical protein VIF15_17865 [Polyangiaceae bacterium]|jgi:hypothetical protein